MGHEPPAVVSVAGTESVEALIGHETVAEPTAPPAWDRGAAVAAKQGRLILYLGAAPGVGKTFAMLSEGRRRAERGTDVVVAWVETYGRPRTVDMLQGLERVPPPPPDWAVAARRKKPAK